MSPRQSLAITKNEARVLLSDPYGYIVLLIMPLVVMVFLNATYTAAFSSETVDVAGAVHSVPGMTSMFALLFTANVGFMFFREHGWSTWRRLRISVSSDTNIVVGKTAPLIILCTGQITVTFGLGTQLFGLEIAGNMLALLLTHFVLALTVVCLGLALSSICRTVMQVNAISQVAALGLGGLGGAFTPVDFMSELFADIAIVSPVYWAIRAYKMCILDIGLPYLELLYLLGFAIASLVVFFTKLDFEEEKIFWS